MRGIEVFNSQKRVGKPDVGRVEPVFFGYGRFEFVFRRGGFIDRIVDHIVELKIQTGFPGITAALVGDGDDIAILPEGIDQIFIFADGFISGQVRQVIGDFFRWLMGIPGGRQIGRSGRSRQNLRVQLIRCGGKTCHTDRHTDGYADDEDFRQMLHARSDR